MIADLLCGYNEKLQILKKVAEPVNSGQFRSVFFTNNENAYKVNCFWNFYDVYYKYNMCYYALSGVW